MKRIYHTWDKWECYRSNFYENSKEGMTKAECEEKYRELLSDTELFSSVLENVITEWTNSCEHYLSNEQMNRIAWLGQAALAYKYKIPSCFRTGYFLLDELEQLAADKVALKYLNKWLEHYDAPPVDLVGAGTKAKANLY
jgi:hypothetical protein